MQNKYPTIRFAKTKEEQEALAQRELASYPEEKEGSAPASRPTMAYWRSKHNNTTTTSSVKESAREPRELRLVGRKVKAKKPAEVVNNSYVEYVRR